MAKKSGKAANVPVAAPEAAATPEAAAVAAPAAPAVPPQPKANGVTRPKTGTKTGRVWEISDSLSAAAGKPVPRADVMQAARAEGINEATIATQYGRWRKFYGIGRVEKPAAEGAVAAPVAEAVDAPTVDDEDEPDEEEFEDEDEE